MRSVLDDANFETEDNRLEAVHIDMSIPVSFSRGLALKHNFWGVQQTSLPKNHQFNGLSNRLVRNVLQRHRLTRTLSSDS
jgi:hypothetical protein